MLGRLTSAGFLLFALFVGYKITLPANLQFTEQASLAVSPKIVRQCGRLFTGNLVNDRQTIKLPQYDLNNIEKVNKLRFIEINSLNLFEYKKTVVTGLDGKPKEVWTSPKPEEQTRALARNILENNPDVVTMIEVESQNALSQFNERYLNSKYEPLLIEGNDSRGIDIGILVKRDLPFEIEMRTHRDLWMKDEPIFSRDLPVLVFKEKQQVKFILLGVHYKSMRGSPQDRYGIDKRTVQAKVTADTILSLKNEFGEGTPIFLTGDFNNHVPTAAEFNSLRMIQLKDALDLFPPTKRFTHYFFEQNGRPNFHQLDAFMFLPSPKIKIQSAEILPNKDEQGRILPAPKNFDEREHLPSDHLPTQVDVEFLN